ncbi:MAG: hypothetical protein PHY09_01205 [Desulfuromonadaceae bacterium]|nr:hypothetical protein [Desulfuromonadaceae bacterium]MDD5104934.1 hypothetical protein [Desulfuromonadaceae bacterium]
MSHTGHISVFIYSVFCAAVRHAPGSLLLLLTFLRFATFPAHAVSRIVKVDIYENAPKVFTSEAGKPSGVFIEIIEHIARQEGRELRHVYR